MYRTLPEQTLNTKIDILYDKFNQLNDKVDLMGENLNVKIHEIKNDHEILEKKTDTIRDEMLSRFKKIESMNSNDKFFLMFTVVCVIIGINIILRIFNL